MKPLPLSSTSSPIRLMTEDEKGSLSEKQRITLRGRTRMCLEMQEMLARGIIRSKTKAAITLSVTTNLSHHRILDLFEAWQKGGQRALIDHRRCGSRGCGMEECGNRSRASALPQSVVEFWFKLASENRHFKGTGTQTLEWAHRQLLHLLSQGSKLGDFGDWKAVWRNLHPAKPYPLANPYSRIAPPKGWSLGNFMERKPANADIAVMQRGFKEMTKHLPQVRRDWASVRPLEVIFTDDKKLNLMVLVEVDGVAQKCELWTLIAVDAATRAILHISYHPRYERKDGTKQGIEMRHAQHLVTAVYLKHGIPKDYTSTIVCENAAMTISDEFREVLDSTSGGKIKVEYSSLWVGRNFIGGFAESGGSPNHKAIIESLNHRLDIELGHIAGQTGIESKLLKPGGFDKQLQITERDMKRLSGRATEAEFEHLITLPSLRAVKPMIEDALHVMQTRNDHGLQGFDSRAVWRMGEGDPWKLLDHPELLRLEAEIGTTALNTFLRSPGRSDWHVESIKERWSRLYVSDQFQRLSLSQIYNWWLDISEPLTYKGNGEFVATLRRSGKFYFSGTSHTAKEGETVVLRFDRDTPELGAVVQAAETLHVLGRASYAERIAWGDEEALQQRFKDRAKVLSATASRINTRHASGDTLAAMLTEQEARILGWQTIDERTRPADTVKQSPADDLPETWTKGNAIFEEQASLDQNEKLRLEEVARMNRRRLLNK